MKTLVMLGVAFSLLNDSFSQKLNVTKSDFDFNFSSTTIHKIFGHDTAFYYVVKFLGNQFYIEKLDKNLDLVKSEPLKLHEGLKANDFETIVHFHNQIYVFSSRRRFNDIILFYHLIDKETLLSSTEFIEIAKIDFIKGNWADFHFALSRKETKLLIACRTKLSLSKVQFNEFYVYGEGFERIWQKKDFIEFKGQGPRDNKYTVDEDGNVSILSLQKRSNIFNLFSSIKNVYTIYRYTDYGETYREYPVTFPNKYIRGLKIVGGDHGELICAGLYSETFRVGIRGTFYFRIAPFDGMIYDNRFNEFDDQFISELAENREPILSDDELMSYVMSDLIFRKNGKIILIAEQVFSQSYNTYNNLIITCIDTTGMEYWHKVIPKKQDYDIRYLTKIEVYPEDYRDYVIETGSINLEAENYCSYALLAPLDRNDIILFYNDHIKNIDQNVKLYNFARPRKSYIAAVSIDEYGNLNKQAPVKWVKKSLYPEPMRYYNNLYETVVIPAFKGRKFNYYKISAEFK